MSFAESVVDAITSATCAALRLENAGTSFFNELSPVDVPNYARYWLPKLCNDDPSEVPVPEPPFTGGQCPVGYRFEYQLFNVSDGSVVGAPVRDSSDDFLFGPITFYGVVQENGLNILRASGLDNQGNPDTKNVSSSGTARSYRNLNVVRSDGQPDDCGSPPVPPPPPWPTGGNTYNISPTYIDNEGNTVNLNGNFTLFAPIAIAGNVFAPVRVDLGGITFDGTLELAPDFTFNFGQPPNTDAPGDGDDLPPNNDPTNSPDTPEDDNQRDIIGIVVTSAPGANTKTTVLPQGDSPTLYLPRIGSAYFRVRTASGLAWFGPIDVKQRRQYIPAPDGVRTLTARTHFETDWSGSVTLVYRDSRAED